MEGYKRTICEDHDALKWIINMVEATCRLVCWRLRLSGFEFDVVQRASIKSQAADALSRTETGGTINTDLDDDLPELVLSLIQHRGEKINFSQGVNSDQICTFNRVMTLARR